MTTKVLLRLEPANKKEEEYRDAGKQYVVKREYGKSPNGNGFYGQWVLRHADGTYIDHDIYRTDLFERNSFTC